MKCGISDDRALQVTVRITVQETPLSKLKS